MPEGIIKTNGRIEATQVNVAAKARSKTLMLNIAASTTGRLPQKFRYGGLEPLICRTPFAVEALKGANGSLTTRVFATAGFITMTGTVEP